jgi:acetyl esterase/lipase
MLVLYYLDFRLVFQSKKLPADIENRTISCGPDVKDISITMVRPPNSSNETLPVIMFFHGGGWILGGFDTHDRLVREIANYANAAIVFVNYTPSPEAKYPVSLEQSYAATKWVAENGQTINVDSSRLAVVGDSVGGNMLLLLLYLPNKEEVLRLISKSFFIQLLMLVSKHHPT